MRKATPRWNARNSALLALGCVAALVIAGYSAFRLQRLVFRLAALVVAPYERPWLFPHAVKIVNDVIARKVVYDDGVDQRELIG